ncbi:MAG: (d)CMP kinase [Myxococcota bacterium]
MDKKRKIIVTIDGPAGSGKSSVARETATKLGYRYLDSGALYRCVALYTLDTGANLDDSAICAKISSKIEIEFVPDAEGQRTLLNGEDVSFRIRSPEVSSAASRISAYKSVRDALFAKQRLMGSGGGLVAEGRDMGTVVFPEAEAKFFLTASVEERAKRRYDELKAKGIDVEFEAILKEQEERDKRDSERDVAPLRPAPDAQVIDTTALTLEQVIDKVYDESLKKISGKS